MGHADSWILLGPVSRQEGCVCLSGIGRARAEWLGHIPAAPPRAITDRSELNGYLPTPFLTPSPSASVLRPTVRLLPTNGSHNLLQLSKCALYASALRRSLVKDSFWGPEAPGTAAYILVLLPQAPFRLTLLPSLCHKQRGRRWLKVPRRCPGTTH